MIHWQLSQRGCSWGFPWQRCDFLPPNSKEGPVLTTCFSPLRCSIFHCDFLHTVGT